MIPQPKANELIERIQAILPERRPSEFVIAAIEREAQKLVSTGTDPARGQMLLGTLAALRFDSDNLFDHFRIALTLSQDWMIRANFIVMARRLGYIDGMLENVEDLPNRYPDNLDVLHDLRGHAVDSMRWGLAKSIRDRLLKLGAAELGLPSSRFDKTAALLVARQSVTHKDMLARHHVATEVVRSAKEPIFGSIFDFSRDGTMSYGLMVRAPIDVIVDLNISIAERIVTRFEDTLADIVTFSCMSQRDAVYTSRLSESREEVK